MNKWRNYGLWAAVFAFVPVCAAALGTYDVNLVMPGNYGEFCTGLLGILVLAGIISNPEKGKWFKDEDEAEEDEEAG